MYRESRRKNAAVGLRDRLHAILKHDGSVSGNFPQDLHTLLQMDGMVALLSYPPGLNAASTDNSVKALMREYCVPLSESQDSNVNYIMRFFGLSYQLVRSPVLPPRPPIH